MPINLKGIGVFAAAIALSLILAGSAVSADRPKPNTLARIISRGLA